MRKSIFCLLHGHSGLTGAFPLVRYFSGVVSYSKDLQVSQYVVSVESSSPVHHGFYP